MKNHFLALLLGATVAFSACENKQSATTEEQTGTRPAPVMEFEERNVTLGKMTEGDTLLHQFRFTNTGNAPLAIQSAIASCGCTVPSYPEKPIAPGQQGVIKVAFNSRNKVGMNTKTITIYANTNPDMNTVSFKVEVLPKAAEKTAM